MTKEQDIKALAEIIKGVKTPCSITQPTGWKCTLYIPYDCCLDNERAKRVLNAGYRLPVKHTVISDKEIQKAWDATFEKGIYLDHKPTADDLIKLRMKAIGQAQVDKDNKEHE
jgi:hypothetical protein